MPLGEQSNQLDPEVVDRWEAQLRKGCLELAILASLWQGRRYGLDILRVLKSNGGLTVAEGTIYPIMNRLRKEGSVDAEWVESDSGHPRRYYSLSKSGRRRTLAMVSRWSEFADNLSSMLAPLRREEC